MCVPDVGCAWLNNTAPCDDGDLCTIGDACADGLCAAGGQAVTCDDGNQCTLDVCDQAGGCTFTPVDGASCADGDSCTLQDACLDGECAPGIPVECDDSNPCTDDACDPQSGQCNEIFNSASCDDGDACTVDEGCILGSCQGGTPLNCDDGDHCTEDSCNPAVGCETSPVAPCCGNGIEEGSEECDDGNNDPNDGCDPLCQSEVGGCVTLGVDVRTLEEPPSGWQNGQCVGDYCEDTNSTIPPGWRIATAAEVAVLAPKTNFGACAGCGITTCYWFESSGGSLLTNTGATFDCPNAGCTAKAPFCYLQVLLVKVGKDGTCTTN